MRGRETAGLKRGHDITGSPDEEAGARLQRRQDTARRGARSAPAAGRDQRGVVVGPRRPEQDGSPQEDRNIRALRAGNRLGTGQRVRVDVGVSAADLSDAQVRDRLLVLDVVNRYGWSCDERDIDSLRRTFAEDAVIDGSVAAQVEIGPFKGRETFVKWNEAHMATQDDQRRHMILNPTFVVQTSTTAVVNAYLMLTSVAKGQPRLVTTGLYRFELEKRDGSWMVIHLFAGFDSAF